MTINIAGNWGEFYCNIAIDGDNASIMMQDANGIITRRGKVTSKEEDKDMVKTKITEITEKYDKDGKLVEKITREESTEGDTTTSYIIPHTNHASQCAKQAAEHAKRAANCCKNAVVVVSTEKASANYA